MSSMVAGTTLCSGRYRLEAVLGRGGMSIVWRATDLQLERDVAIKVISDVLASDPSFVARFEREARLAAGLNHPNLVKVFDFSVDSERPFLIMEHVAGGTLAEARGQALPVESLARELLDAVAHIHGAGILHRDIKPANVLLGPEGSPRLTDFGIARGEETSALTQTGQVLGTLRYIAPEVAAGEPATAQSDLYSLGVLLGELTGERSEALDRLIARLSAREPHERPATAAEALSELDPTRILDRTDPLERTERLAPTEPLAGAAAAAGRLHAGRFSRAQAIGAALVLLVVLALVIGAASGGGGHTQKQFGIPKSTSQLQPAPAGAPASQQIDRLERIVRTAPAKR